jgi:putative oxidoreductase
MAIEQTVSRYAPTVLSLLRIIVALLFIEHGTGKMFGFPSAAATATTPAMFSMYWFAASIEIVGGILLLVGLCTRPVAFVMSGEMAFAYFLSHYPRNFYPLLNGGDAAVLFCLIFFYFAFAGAGPLSLDAMWRKQA